eukprot:scaffold75035_cov56-Phaeocystis_antarctica.AAC.4
MQPRQGEGEVGEEAQRIVAALGRGAGASWDGRGPVRARGRAGGLGRWREAQVSRAGCRASGRAARPPRRRTVTSESSQRCSRATALAG